MVDEVVLAEVDTPRAEFRAILLWEGIGRACESKRPRMGTCKLRLRRNSLYDMTKGQSRECELINCIGYTK